MIQTFKINNLRCELVRNSGSGRLVYMIYPAVEPLPAQWLEQNAATFGVSIAVVYVPGDQWDNYLTPWPAPGVPKSSPPFKGDAEEFLAVLKNEVIPKVESSSGLEPSERCLVGVSLAGLFTLWQWLLDDTFRSIGCVSGSFWYQGFIDWFNRQPLPPKSGKAVFLLGTQEPLARTKAFRSVGMATQTVVDRLKTARIPTEFTWVPGDHFANPLGRAHLILQSLLT